VIVTSSINIGVVAWRGAMVVINEWFIMAILGVL
jgi:hypothetical protein